MKKTVVDWIALVLVVIGALNWGLVGVNSFSGVNYGWDLVSLLLGSVAWLAAVVYILVALAGLYLIYFALKE